MPAPFPALTQWPDWGHQEGGRLCGGRPGTCPVQGAGGGDAAGRSLGHSLLSPLCLSLPLPLLQTGSENREPQESEK